MSDYLSNLAARSLNVAEAIQPQSRSLFEPQSVTGVPTPGQDFGLEGLDEISADSGLPILERVSVAARSPGRRTPPTLSSALDFGLDSTGESSKSWETNEQFNNPKSQNQGASYSGEDLLKAAPQFLQSLDGLTRMPDQHDRIPPRAQPQPPILTPLVPVETRIEPPPAQPPTAPTPLVLPQPSIEERQKPNPDQPRVTPATASAQTKATPSSSATEPQSQPRSEQFIQRIVERVASPDEPKPRTIQHPDPSPILTPVLPPAVLEPLSGRVPQQRDPEQPKLTPAVARETIDTRLIYATSDAENQSPVLDPIVQRIVTERVVSPVEPSAKVTPHREASPTQTILAATSARVVVQPQVTPYVEPKASAPVQATATPEPIPTIQVTIGRIEVRATPPPTTPSQRQRSAPPVMTLDQYLGQRAKGGGR